MKRYFLATALIFTISFLISGCLEYTQKAEIMRDGSGSMTIRYSFPPGSDLGRTYAQRFDTATIRREVTEEAYTIKKISTQMKEGDQWSAEIEITFKNVSDLNSTRLFNRFDIFFGDGAAGQMKFSQYLKPLPDKPDPRNPVKQTFIFEFDGEMITHNAHKTDGNKYIWEFTLDQIGDGKYIEATFAPQEPNYIVFYIIGGVLVVAAAGFILFRRKKRA